MKMYDAHCHLNIDDLYEQWETYLKNFVDNGGAGIINAGCNDSYNEKGLIIAKKFHQNNIIVKSTLGFHPEVVGKGITQDNLQEKITDLKVLIEDSREYVVAVGECGIDLHFVNETENLAIQTQLFKAQCELARELDIPIVIHSRDAFDQTLDVLKEYQDLIVYFHCRGYSPDEVQKLIDMKFKRLYIGFCGNVTYKNAENLRESLKVVPENSLLLETDSPYLAPQAVRGAMNEPTNVKYIYEFVADYLSVDIKKLAQQCERNFKELCAI